MSLLEVPVVRCHRAKEVQNEPAAIQSMVRWTRSCPRTGGALRARPKVTEARTRAQAVSIVPSRSRAGFKAPDGRRFIVEHLEDDHQFHHPEDPLASAGEAREPHIAAAFSHVLQLPRQHADA